jgi:hypothetical protein
MLPSARERSTHSPPMPRRCAGFPIASPGDFEAVKLIATEVGTLTENRASGCVAQPHPLPSLLTQVSPPGIRCRRRRHRREVRPLCRSCC